MSEHPRLDIVSQATPLEPLDKLSLKLGIDLWIKRDDLAGPTFGGNKSRQLEYYLGAAKAEGADTILITGAVQSNFVRTAAACANRVGMRTIVQLEERVAGQGEAYYTSGNVLLLGLLGAEVLRYPEGEDEHGADAALHAKAAELRAEGRKPYVIPLAEGHPPLGALGYMRGAAEILRQKADFDFFVVSSGSAMTHSGLLAGVRAQGSHAQVIGSCVRRGAKVQVPRLERTLARLAELDVRAAQVKAGDIVCWDGALTPGYGLCGPQAMSAMKMLAEEEGLLVDPVYTAKSFAAIPALVADGTIPKGSKVCFVHTGGLAALFAYDLQV